MERIKIPLLIGISVISLGLLAFAQPTIPKGRIPSNIDSNARRQIKNLYSSEPQERASAAKRLGEMGEQALAATPFLIGIFDDSINGYLVKGEEWADWGSYEICRCYVAPGNEAAKALVKLGELAFVPLLDALEHKDWRVRVNAIWALGEIKDIRAVTALISVLNDGSETVRSSAIHALGKITRKDFGEDPIKWQKWYD